MRRYFLIFSFSILILLINACAHDYALFREGKRYYESQDYDRAAEKFRQLKNKYPQSNIVDLADEYLRRIEELTSRQKGKPEEPLKTPVIPIKEEKKEISEKPEKLFSNVFYDTDIKEIIRHLSTESGINIVMDDTVQGVLSIRYENMTLEEILKLVLAPGGYTYKKMDGYYLVGSADPRSPLFNYLSKTVYVKPRFLKAKEISKLISPSFTSYIQVNEERNILTITASPELVERILNDIMKIDRKPRQVSLEAIVVEVSSEGRKSLGIDWSGQSGKFSGSMENLDVTFTYISTPSVTRQITSKIHALVEDGLAQIKATPRVTTMDGEEASINIGLEQYISLVTGPVTYPYVKLETIKAGVTLNILPLISEDNTILVKIKPAEVSDFIETGKDGLPIINKRSVATTVMVKNQETIVIGGLIRKREVEKVSRFPILGYIPLLNLIFSKREKIVEDSEVLILITPRIIDISS